MSDNFQDNVSIINSSLVMAGDAVVIGTGAGAKSIIFNNSDSAGHLVWQPNANATISFPAAGGTIQTVGGAPGAIVAGDQTATSGTIVFSNSNNITFGMSDSTRITASYQFNVSACTTSNNLNSLSFGNGSGVTFGLNAGTITASVSQTNQTIGLYALGNTTQNSSTTLDARTLSFNGLGIITAGYSNGSIQISATQSVQTQSNIAGIYDGANSISTGTIIFTNANGVSFSINGQTISGSVLAQTNQTLGLYAVSNTTGQSSSSTFDARTLSFHGAGIASVGYSGGSVVISVPTGGGDGDGVNIIAAGTQTANTTGTIMFSNSNNITFGMTDSSIVTASYNFNLSAGTTSNNLNSIVFSNSNGVSFGLNGSTVTASAGAIFAGYAPYDEGPMVAGQQGQATLHLQPLQPPAFQHDRLLLSVNYSNATNSTGSITISMWVGMYTQNNSTLSLSQSISTSYAITFSGTGGDNSIQAGPRQLTIPWTSTWAQSNYWIGIVSRTTSAGANASFSQFLVSDVNSNFSGIFGISSAATRQRRLGLGVYTATTSGIPGSIGFSQLNGTASMVMRQPVIVFGSGTA